MSRNIKTASIIIVNFNNARFLKKSIDSALKQNFRSKEIIVIDDISTDNSLKILRGYGKKIRYYVNKKKTKHGSYNQMNSFVYGFKKAKGKYLFFLDSDDYFKKNKLKAIIAKFVQKDVNKIIFDLPILKFGDKTQKSKFVQKKFILSNWPRFTPQSCISIRKDYFNKIYKIFFFNKYPTLWLDFRLACVSYLLESSILVCENHLTFYRQLEFSASKKYERFNKNWWLRRDEAHKFYDEISKKLKIKKKVTVDKVLTKFINLFLND